MFLLIIKSIEYKVLEKTVEKLKNENIKQSTELEAMKLLCKSLLKQNKQFKVRKHKKI